MKPDSLTRRSQDLPQDFSDERLQDNQVSLLKPHQVDPKISQTIQKSVQETINSTSSIELTKIKAQATEISKGPCLTLISVDQSLQELADVLKSRLIEEA